MNVLEKLFDAVKSRKTGLTISEAVERLGVNPNTARKEFGFMRDVRMVDIIKRKCRVSGKIRTAYTKSTYVAVADHAA